MSESTRRKVNLNFDQNPSFHHVFNLKFSLPYIRNKKILDIGCWTGQFERIASKYTKTIMGIDPGKDAIRIARKTVKGSKFEVGDALKLNFKDKSFDAVTILDVIEHIPKGTESICLDEIWRVLKDKGYIIISTPHSHPLSTFLDPAFFIIGHRHYSEKNLRSLLNLAKFKIIKTKKTGGLVRIATTLIEYFYKHILRKPYVISETVEDKIKNEYKSKNAFAQINIVAQKII